MDKITVSILIRCRNEEKFIEGASSSVLEFEDPDQIIQEILLIDGMSIDNTKNTIRKLAVTDDRIK